MTSLVFGTSAYSRTRGNLPELPLINMFVEATPTTASNVVLQSRPGMEVAATRGSGPIYGLYQAAGVVSGSVITVSGSTVFVGETVLGTILGDGPVSFAASETELLINAGAGIYRTNGSTLTLVSFPDNADVYKLVSSSGYFVALRRGTQQLYFSGVLDGASWQALDYASAENDPDPLIDAQVVNDMLVLLGSRSVEFWVKTGDPDAPFQPTEGRVFQKGVIGPGCSCVFDNTVAWIGSNHIVYIAGNVPERISDAGIEERIGQSDSFLLWCFAFEGHEFLVVRLSQGSWLFDAQTRQWCEFQTYGRANWRVRAASQDGTFFGDDEDGSVWQFAAGHRDGDGPLERRFRAGAPISGGTVSADNVRLTVNVGETTDLTGYTADPSVEMRTSRDGGRQWGIYRASPLGAQGNYRTRCEWRRCGLFDDPGMLAEFRVVDPVPFRVSGVGINEMGGGRSR